MKAILHLRRMSTLIPQVKDVDIEPKGVFKYILVKLSVPQGGGKLEEKLIVRGYAECPYHTDINNKVISELDHLKAEKSIETYETVVLGGGKMEHDPESQQIQVFGISTGYGKADHELTAKVLEKCFPNYQITVSEK